MTRQRLYVVHGKGNDAVGLVGNITAPISEAGGNIVDLRQDLMHGLFSILLVVDLTATELRIEDFTDMIAKIGEETGLEMTVDRYNPTPRDPEKKNVLLILIGKDRPGIIATMSEMLGKYNANIEFAQSIGREGVFLTELITDISHCSIPLVNLQTTVSRKMSELDIQAVFQSEDVFNKKKRVILFDIGSSFIDAEQRAEILSQTGLTEKDVCTHGTSGSVADALQQAAGLLEGVPAEVIQSVATGITPTPGTMELLQTLRVMGYTIALASNGLDPFIDVLKNRLGLDYAFGYPLPIDDDSQTVVGEIAPHELAGRDLELLIATIQTAEGVYRADVAVISDEGLSETPGIRLRLDLGQILDYYNKKIISRDALLGLLGSIGVPHSSR